MNVPPVIAAAASSGLTTLLELRTSYSVRDLHDLLEVHQVNAHNARIIAKWRARKRRREEGQ